MYTRRTFALALGLILAGATMAQTSIAVKPGQKFKVETEMKMNSSAEVMGQTMENNIDSKTTTLYTVKSSSASAIELSSALSKAVVAAAMMGQDLSYDSDKKDNSGPLADNFDARMNKEKSISLDGKGYITKQDEEEGGSPLMGGGGPNNQIELFAPALSGRTLKAGESFEFIDTYKKEKLSTRDSGTYKVNAIENGVASLSYLGVQYTAAVMEQMGMEMNTSATNKVKTELQVDLKTGVILAKTSEIESAISVVAGDMTIPATGKTTISSKTTPVQ